MKFVFAWWTREMVAQLNACLRSENERLGLEREFLKEALHILSGAPG